jgi:hypothetical protein
MHHVQIHRRLAAMTFSISGFQMFVLPMRTRFPFRYGIASMTALPHLIVEVRVVVDGQAESVGLAADGLAPKWFTKRPELPLEAEFAEMIAVVQNAVRVARHAATQPRGFAAWWRDVYDEMQRWGQHTGTPPLLANLGVSLVERAVLDALCRAAATPLHRVLRSGSLGLDLGIVRDSLAGMSAADALAPQPVQRMAMRHTVGLSDALRAADVPSAACGRWLAHGAG